MWQSIKKFLEPIKKILPAIYVSMAIKIIRTFLDFGQGFITKYILDSIVSKDINSTLLYIFIFLGIVVLRHPTALYLGRRRIKTNAKVHQILYEKYIGQYLISDNNKVESIGSGRFNSIIKQGIESSRAIIDLVSIQFAEVLVSSILGFIVIFYYSRVAGCILLLVCIIVFLIAKRQERILIPLKKESKNKSTELDRNILRSIQTKFEIMQSGKIKNEVITINTLQEDVMKRMATSIYRARQMYVNLPTFIVDICTIAGYYFLAVGIINGSYSIGTFALFTMIAGNFRGYLRRIGEINTQIAEQLIHISKLQETFEATPEIKNYYEGEEYKVGNGTIRIENIGYGYNLENPVFEDFSLTIPGGKKIALVGSSGSGKTTLVKLISGYLHSDTGSIYIDNQNIKDLSLKSYYQHIGYLTQEPSVFDGSILDNLMYGFESINGVETREQLTQEQQQKISTAIDQAQCQFIYNFPEKVQTQIGEKGIKLSGGQKQRLAIAKLMLKNPQIIILDEPTSALDSFAEEEVTKALNNLFQGRTVIVIAHRLQTVKHADEIIVLGEAKERKSEKTKGLVQSEALGLVQSEALGLVQSEALGLKSNNDAILIGTQIIERGTHEELVAKGGVYAQMLELQSGF